MMHHMQVTDQRANFGPNQLTPANIKPAWLLYIEQYTNFFSLLLIAGGVLCFIAYGAWTGLCVHAYDAICAMLAVCGKSVS